MRLQMSIEAKYVYYESGLYIVTEEKRLDSEETTLPFDLYKDKIKVAVGYIRWSDEKQNSGHSYSIQERAIISKAQSLECQCLVIFVEVAKSAYHYTATMREKMKSLKEFILNNSNANTVIFYEESRITRAISDFSLDVIVPLREKKANLKLFSTQQEHEWNENDPLVQMKLALYHEESFRKAIRVKDAQNTIFYNQERPPASNPFGYSKGKNKEGDLLPDENAEIVMLIFHLYSFGHSDKKIADLLEHSQVPSPNGYGNWSDSSVRYILNNRWYIGDLVWDSRMSFLNSQKKPLEEVKLFSNHHPVLIEAGLWETTQFFRNLKTNGYRMDSPFILKNLVACKECGNDLKTKNPTSSKSKTDGSVYYCSTCNGKILKDQLNNFILQDFANRWGREIKYYFEQLENGMLHWKKVCKRKIKELSEEIEQTRMKVAKVKSTDDNYELIQEIVNKQLNDLEKEKAAYAQTKEQIERLLKEQVTIELLERFKQNVQLYSNTEKRSILLLVINSIVYDFKKNDFEIEYRLTPYVEIENLMSINN